MWSPDASAILIKWKAQLLVCQAIIDLGILDANVHYPNFDFEQDTLPCLLVGETNHRRFRYAEGAAGLINFDCLAKLYLKVGSGQDAGTIETIGRDINLQLWNQFYGMAWRDIDVKLSSEPTAAQRADGDKIPNMSYRAILITANIGLDRK